MYGTSYTVVGELDDGKGGVKMHIVAETAPEKMEFGAFSLLTRVCEESPGEGGMREVAFQALGVKNSPPPVAGGVARQGHAGLRKSLLGCRCFGFRDGDYGGVISAWLSYRHSHRHR